jgi:hypothetical protein
MTGWVTNNGSTHASPQLQPDPVPERRSTGFERGGSKKDSKVEPYRTASPGLAF